MNKLVELKHYICDDTLLLGVQHCTLFKLTHWPNIVWYIIKLKINKNENHIINSLNVLHNLYFRCCVVQTLIHYKFLTYMETFKSW